MHFYAFSNSSQLLIVVNPIGHRPCLGFHRKWFLLLCCSAVMHAASSYCILSSGTRKNPAQSGSGFFRVITVPYEVKDYLRDAVQQWSTKPDIRFFYSVFKTSITNRMILYLYRYQTSPWFYQIKLREFRVSFTQKKEIL